jgi:hypothetical protein
MTEKNKFTTTIKTWPFFLLLLPVFFVLHEYIAHYNAVPVVGSMVLILTYVLASCAIAALAWFFFRDLHKAALMTLLLMSYYFFYGSMKDVLLQQFPESFLNRYRFIIPFTVLLFIISFAWLKRRKRPLTRFILYINVLLAILVVFDLGSLSIKVLTKKFLSEPAVSKLLTLCDTCSKPDIFLIISDGYTSNKSLKAHFGFDNAAFENELVQRGFYIAPNSTSNYNFTLYSLPSILNMDYVIPEKNEQRYNVNHAYNQIRENIVTKYLIKSEYRFYNCSLFDVGDQPANDHSHFIPSRVKIITSQTFINRLEKDFLPDLLAGRFGSSLQKKYAYSNLNFNDTILSLTGDIASQKTGIPKFVYSHLVMPHYPYYYNSEGNLSPIDKLNGEQEENKKNYIGYLEYANRKILGLIDHILSSSQKPPVIILMGDHGFRHPQVKLDVSQSFLNMNSVYLPGRNYSGFYDSISCVNQFRMVLNTCFNQHLPLLKDSTIIIRPKGTY